MWSKVFFFFFSELKLSFSLSTERKRKRICFYDNLLSPVIYGIICTVVRQAMFCLLFWMECFHLVFYLMTAFFLCVALKNETVMISGPGLIFLGRYKPIARACQKGLLLFHIKKKSLVLYYYYILDKTLRYLLAWMDVSFKSM